jgi:hypothetical protein
MQAISLTDLVLKRSLFKALSFFSGVEFSLKISTMTAKDDG